MEEHVVYLGEISYSVQLLKRASSDLGAKKRLVTLRLLIVGGSIDEVESEGPILVVMNGQGAPVWKVHVNDSQEVTRGVVVDAHLLAI